MFISIFGGASYFLKHYPQLHDITFETAKGYIDEIAKKYAGKSIQNTTRAGAKKMTGKKILQIPKQKESIPKEIKEYAKEAKVKIREVEDVTMDMLEFWK